MTGTTLRIDEAAWRTSLDRVRDATPGLVPVAKGNGYGFGLPRLAEEATRLGADTIAVGTPGEVDAVADRFPGTIVVLTPWPGAPADDPRIVPTISRLDELRRLAASDNRPRALVEVATSMRRHGLAPAELADAAPLIDRLDFAGWTIHLPIGDTAAEAVELARTATAARPAPLWFSHVGADRVARIGAELGVETRLRLGTGLWLADPSAYRATSTVLDVHRVRRGERAGYRQRKVPGDGWVVVVSGGTANGIGLEAPTAATTLRQRLTAVAGGGLAATGRALSPFELDGRKRWFLEPPHMQSSLIFLPAGSAPPAIGDEVPVTVRMTTYLPDATAA